ncbi:hypothetical protein K3495_g87 [Podosphaera aphanis]|nr:hypothetical protein K3495_g87 [Podosphaera aphanis]
MVKLAENDFSQQMPRRQFLPKTCWHMFELPIPKFLAPRVFEPWPRSRRGLHKGTSRQENPPTASLDHSNDRKMINNKPSSLAPHIKMPKNQGERAPTSGLHMHGLTIQCSREARWRELVFWLNKVTRYAIEVKKNSGLLPADWQAFRPRISEEEVNNILTDIAENSLDWENRNMDRRDRIWLELMAQVLHTHPDKALDVLEATLGKENGCLSQPCIVVADVIYCIILHHFSDLKSCMSEEYTEIASRIFHFQLNLPFSFSAPFNNHSTFLLMSNLPKERLCDFYSYHFVRKQSDLSVWTLMQFASKLAKFGETDLAFDAVKKLTKTDIQINRPNTLSIITSLLHGTSLNEIAENKVEDMFQYLVTCGMKPNIFTYNVLLHYITKIPEPQAAWELHDDMIKDGILPDSITYSILLNDAKRRLDSTDMKRVIDLTREHGINSKYIVTDMLHAIFLLRKGEPPVHENSSEQYNKTEPSFDQMLRLYSEYFRIGPLLQVIPWLADVYSPPDLSREDHLWAPPGATICVMVTGFLEIVNSQGAKEFYDHFRKLVRTGNGSINFLLRRSYVYNVILMCFYKFEERAKDAPQVIADMLSIDRDPPNPVLDPANPSESSSIKDKHYEPLPPVKPDIFTWSILVKIFMRLQYSRAAEKVLHMMSRRNIKPTMVTWTSLIAGYARMQNPSMVADAVLRLERAGYQPDDHIYKVLSKVHHQDKLIKEIELLKIQSRESVKAKWLNELNDDLAIDIAQKKLMDEDEF